MWQYNATPTAVPSITGGALGPPTQTRRLEVGVVAGIHAPATARAAVERWLSGRVSEKFFDDVRLLVSELVTNSVRHADVTRDATVRLSVEMAGGVVRLEVEDSGDGAIQAVPPDREHGGGFGLYIVDALAERWGSAHDGNTRVWAELSVSPAT